MANYVAARNVTSKNDSDLEGTTAVWNTTTYNASINYQSKAKLLHEQMSRVQLFICPLLLVVGLLGNCFIILTVSHIKFRQTTTRYILCALAFSDSLLLLTNPFNQQFMRTVWKYGDLRALSEIGCKTFFVIYRVAKTSSSWFVVLIAVERFIAVMYPLKAKTVITRRRMLAAISTVYLILIIIQIIRSFFTGIVDGMCSHDLVTANTMDLHKVSNIIGPTVYSLLPISILVSLTPLIIISLMKRNRRRQTFSKETKERSERDTSRVSFMLVGVVVSYIVWVTPITLAMIIATATNQHVFGSKNQEMIILQGVALTFEQLNHSCNFMIYIVFSQVFRHRFLDKVYCGRRIRCRRSTPSTSHTFDIYALNDSIETRVETTQTEINDVPVSRTVNDK